MSSLQPSSMESRRRRRNAISSSWIYLKKIFTSKPCTAGLDAQLTVEEAAEATVMATVCSGRCSMHFVVSTALHETMAVSDSQRKIPVVTRLESGISADHQFFPLQNDIFSCPTCGKIFRKSHILEQHQTLKHAVSELIDGDSENNIVSVVTRLEFDISADHQFFPLRNDIFPCPACGKIFQKSHILEQHQTLKHAVSELIDGDSGNNIVRIIFRTGWIDNEKTPKIHRILKIHNNTKILGRFEEYREHVKSKAARNSGVRRRDERRIANGNELLRFHYSTFLYNEGLLRTFTRGPGQQRTSARGVLCWLARTQRRH